MLRFIRTVKASVISGYNGGRIIASGENYFIRPAYITNTPAGKRVEVYHGKDAFDAITRGKILLPAVSGKATNGTYFIALNDPLIGNEFVLLHEMGHIDLGHFDSTVPMKFGVVNSQQLEIDADEYAFRNLSSRDSFFDFEKHINEFASKYLVNRKQINERLNLLKGYMAFKFAA